MKKQIIILSLFISHFFGVAYAAGLYDGIYLDDVSQSTYLTVYQSNSTLITTLYSVNDVTGVSLSTAGGTVYPSVLDVFTVRNGTITGSTATINGYAAYRACNLTLGLSFFTQGVNAVIASVSSSPLGAAQGYNCRSSYPLGSTVSFSKIL